MSISALSKSEIPQPVEEIERWRQQMNNGEENSPMLSRRGELSPKMQGAKGKPYFYITLAKESPQRIYESDASTYDIAFHCMETDVCRDSSDTDSNSSFTTDGIATMDVLEYEVRSASASEDLYSCNSSSGDEEFMLAAFATAMYHSSSSYSSAFADTEESDSDNVFDSELSSADYWVCVKCKNKQNNPMFRYCEKCYQIRKNHFPPRPRQWKSRTKVQELRSPHSRRFRNTRSKDQILQLKDSNNGSLIENGVVSCLGKFDNFSKNNLNKYYNGAPKYNGSNKKSQLNSAAETSSDEESWSDSYSKNVPKRKRRSLAVMKGDKISTNTSSSQNVNICANISNDLNSSISRKRKVSANEEPVAKIGRMAKNFNSTAFADSNSETDFNNTQTQKDSGISSGGPSSQEIPSSSTMSDDLPNVERVHESDSSDDTVCEELDMKDIIELQKSERDSENFIRKISSDISVLQNNCAAGSSGPVVKSVSACTEQGNIFPKNRINVKDDNSEPYGSCIICLSEPKNGVFVHSKFVHLCCCYNCAVKIWSKTKRCPVCNCAVKNVMKLFVH